ncbi:MAG: phosphate ABC transporter substrate-binding protein [Candidatus Omnitrophica bacterium]|nr:phosphate ABC transporter substrate-binding protein [Candidatus Omnitrophota bacterium]
MLKRIACLWVTAIFLSPAFAAIKQDTLQIKGSDTMVNLVQSWAERYMEIDPAVFIAVTGGGSGTGIAALINSACDLAASSRSMKEEEIKLAETKGVEPVQHVVGLDGIAVVVNPKNPVDKLTMAQLRDIFMGKVKNWKELGGEDKKIVILSREINSGTHVFFKEQVLRRGIEKGPEEFAPDALLMPSSQAIADEVAQNPNAIGYYGMGYISPKQKVVAVAKDEQSEYIIPDIKDIVNGKYPISRPLYLYTNGQPQGLLKKFLDFVLSKEGQDIVLKTDFIPVR